MLAEGWMSGFESIPLNIQKNTWGTNNSMVICTHFSPHPIIMPLLVLWVTLLSCVIVPPVIVLCYHPPLSSCSGGGCWCLCHSIVLIIVPLPLSFGVIMVPVPIHPPHPPSSSSPYPPLSCCPVLALIILPSSLLLLLLLLLLASPIVSGLFVWVSLSPPHHPQHVRWGVGDA